MLTNHFTRDRNGGNAFNTSIADKRYVNDDGDKMSGILDMGGSRIINVGDPDINNDVAHKKYVDDKEDSLLNALRDANFILNNIDATKITSGTLHMNRLPTEFPTVNFNNINRIFGLPDPLTSQEPATKGYLDDEIKKLKKLILENGGNNLS